MGPLGVPTGVISSDPRACERLRARRGSGSSGQSGPSGHKKNDITVFVEKSRRATDLVLLEAVVRIAKTFATFTGALCSPPEEMTRMSGIPFTL